MADFILRENRDEHSPTESTSPTLAPCKNPDFSLRSVDGVTLETRKDLLLEGSDLFRDMFESLPYQGETTLDMAESIVTLTLLLSVIHQPPLVAPPPLTRPNFQVGKPEPSSPLTPPLADNLIPFPHLQELLVHIAPKYQLSGPLTEALHTQLAAYSPNLPLEVYALAWQLSLHDIAANTSRFLITPHISTYTVERVRIFPDAESYHRLLLLQDFRKEEIRRVLREEELFPFDYGTCVSHGQLAKEVWDLRREEVMKTIDAGSDVALDMSAVLLDTPKNCETCKTGFVRAIEMIRYKCYRVPRRISDMSVNQIQVSSSGSARQRIAWGLPFRGEVKTAVLVLLLSVVAYNAWGLLSEVNGTSTLSHFVS